MDITIPETRPKNGSDRFGFSLFLAVAVHALVIFGLSFKLHQQQQASPTIEVTLAQHRIEETPEEVDFLAQHNQQGSGNQPEAKELTTEHQAEISDNQLKQVGTPYQPPEQFSVTEQQAVIATTTEREIDASENPTPEDNQQVVPTPIQGSPSMELASLKAKLDQKQQEYSKLPKILRITSASTKSAEHASYLRYWIDRIEMVGNNNYPEEARRKALFGNLRLAVTILPNGSVDSVEILLSSGQRVLDQAAVRTVRLASPFAPFPKEMKQWDKLEIIRTWHFEPGNYLNTDN